MSSGAAQARRIAEQELKKIFENNPIFTGEKLIWLHLAVVLRDLPGDDTGRSGSPLDGDGYRGDA
ncbi:hypothetical protein [Methylobacterium oryzae]|uniref:hypothetical protein n=1 Tax=Methylobacterium oryzae TaxID=334852 RepID=UPI002F35E63B